MAVPRFHYLGCGSYGSIYHKQETQQVLKVHGLNQIGPSLQEPDHEFHIQSKVFETCSVALETLQIRIAQPFQFGFSHVGTDTINLDVLESDKTSTYFTMDYIQGGPKWNLHLKQSLKLSNLPPYLFMGTLEEGPNRIIPSMFKDCLIQDIPNDAYSYCVNLGHFATGAIERMISSFFILVDAGFVPRDIEFVLDGTQDTNTDIAIFDFNEVMTIHERASAYGHGYDTDLDVAHVYIDLCGLRSTKTRNPMAPYDVPTPQWKFLCNPMVAPAAFCTLFRDKPQIASHILHYTLIHTIVTKLKALSRWKPVFIRRIPLAAFLSQEHKESVWGPWTESEYYAWRSEQAHFSCPNMTEHMLSDKKYMYVECREFQRDHYKQDIFLEFDIEFQSFILSSLMQTAEKRGIHVELPSWNFQECLGTFKSTLHTQIQVENCWNLWETE